MTGTDPTPTQKRSPWHMRPPHPPEALGGNPSPLAETSSPPTAQALPAGHRASRFWKGLAARLAFTVAGVLGCGPPTPADWTSNRPQHQRGWQESGDSTRLQGSPSGPAQLSGPGLPDSQGAPADLLQLSGPGLPSSQGPSRPAAAQQPRAAHDSQGPGVDPLRSAARGCQLCQGQSGPAAAQWPGLPPTHRGPEADPLQLSGPGLPDSQGAPVDPLQLQWPGAARLPHLLLLAKHPCPPRRPRHRSAPRSRPRYPRPAPVCGPASLQGPSPRQPWPSRTLLAHQFQWPLTCPPEGSPAQGTQAPGAELSVDPRRADLDIPERAEHRRGAPWGARKERLAQRPRLEPPAGGPAQRP